MKKCKKILLVIFIVVLLLFLGMSYFIGTQVFMGSTQLVTCEDTSKVGKTFFCNRLKEQLGIATYSASKLIAEKRSRNFSADKIVEDIDENQLFLLKAIDELREKEDEFILDGHFCLLDGKGCISRVPMNTYTSLKPDSIVLLMEQPSVIATHRLQRDRVVVEEADIESFQREEKIYAEEIAKKLGVPLIVSTGSSDLENVIQKIRQGGL